MHGFIWLKRKGQIVIIKYTNLLVSSIHNITFPFFLPGKKKETFPRMFLKSKQSSTNKELPN